jgi:hypothetical protein
MNGAANPAPSLLYPQHAQECARKKHVALTHNETLGFTTALSHVSVTLNPHRKILTHD